MAVATTNNRISYSGNGATTAFSFPYKFLANADLVVIVRNNTTGAETPKALTTHYTVTGAGEDAGGTVTMIAAPASGESLVIYDDPDATQSVDFQENDSLPSGTLEEALDRLTVLVQRLQNRMDRALRLSDGFSPSFDTTLPADLDSAGGKVPVINDAGDGWADVADWADPDEVQSGALLTAHNADTTGVHGITDTAQLMTLDTAQTVAAVKTFDVPPVFQEEASAPSAPAAGYQALYMKTTGLLYRKNSAGVESVVGGGGGGGSAIVWEELGNSPIKDAENNMSVYLFEAAQAQELFAEVHVPNSYVAGNPIALKIKAYSPDTSGTILMLAQATLIRAENDDVSSTTNQRTTTNTEITMDSSNDAEVQKISLDLSDSSGQINSTAINPGDTILVRLYRDSSDTATSDIRFLHKQCEVTFA